jgi:hypothetical protein
MAQQLVESIAQQKLLVEQHVRIEERARLEMLRAVALGNPAPGEVLARVNDLLHSTIPAGMFVTCFYAILDPYS